MRSAWRRRDAMAAVGASVMITCPRCSSAGTAGTRERGSDERVIEVHHGRVVRTCDLHLGHCRLGSCPYILCRLHPIRSDPISNNVTRRQSYNGPVRKNPARRQAEQSRTSASALLYERHFGVQTFRGASTPRRCSPVTRMGHLPSTAHFQDFQVGGSRLHLDFTPRQ